eukprot:6067775-Amphidinium_carterae.1
MLACQTLVFQSYPSTDRKCNCTMLTISPHLFHVHRVYYDCHVNMVRPCQHGSQDVRFEDTQRVKSMEAGNA